jgi:hypothetical protein
MSPSLRPSCLKTTDQLLTILQGSSCWKETRWSSRWGTHDTSAITFDTKDVCSHGHSHQIEWTKEDHNGIKANHQLGVLEEEPATTATTRSIGLETAISLEETTNQGPFNDRKWTHPKWRESRIQGRCRHVWCCHAVYGHQDNRQR